MAKKTVKRLALLWEKYDLQITRGQTYAGQFYCGESVQDIIQKIILGEGWASLRPDNIREFQKDLERGLVKVGIPSKNHNINKETNAYETVSDGEFFVDGMLTKNVLTDHFRVMSSFVCKNRSYGMYYKFESVRPLTDDELACIKQGIENGHKKLESDNVFGLFTTLCCTSGIWESISETAAIYVSDLQYATDNRERHYIHLKTTGKFGAVESAEFIDKARFIATNALEVLKKLTGFELYLKEYPNESIVDGMISARFLTNDDVEVRKVCEPTMDLESLLESATNGKNEAISSLLTSTKITSNLSPLESYLAPKDVFHMGLYSAESVKYMDKFKSIPKCFCWVNGDVNLPNLYVYMWGETATTLDLVDGDLDKFIEMWNNK